MLLPGFSRKTDVWTAWNDIREEGKFVREYHDWSILNWSNWGSNQPNGGRDENCVVAHGADFIFHDYPCESKHLPLCKYDPA